MDKSNRRKEISEFARKLSELAKSAPDGYARAELYRSLNFLRHRYKISPELRNNLILKKISEGARSFAEILNETGFTKHQLECGLKQLQEEQKIKLMRVRLHDGGGRPRPEYYLV